MTTTAVGRATDGKPITLHQLQGELIAAGVDVGLVGLGMSDGLVYTYDAAGQATDFAVADQAVVDQTIANHIALRDKTDAEYATEFQAAATTAVRRQDIRDITAGLLPREKVRVDNGG
jgi:hypothetical protein